MSDTHTTTATVSAGSANDAETETVTVRLPPPTHNPVLAPAPVYDVYALSDARTQTLRRLLEQGHAAVAPLRNPQLILHSHLPHVRNVGIPPPLFFFLSLPVRDDEQDGERRSCPFVSDVGHS